MADTKTALVLTEITQQQVREYLNSHPDVLGNHDGLRSYEVAISNMIVQMENLLKEKEEHNDRRIYEAVPAAIRPIFEDEDTSEELAYAAYVALCTFYRRARRHQELETLLTTGKAGFKNKISYQFISLMCQKLKNPNDWTLLEKADHLCQPGVMGYNIGVEHCFAEYVADACENDETRAAYFVKHYMDKAIARVEDAINKSIDENNGKTGYPKFYITKARLLNINAIYGDPGEQETSFNQSQSYIAMAASVEPSMNRKLEYQVIGDRLQSQYYRKTLARSIKRQEEELAAQIRESNVKNLEFLSFFSAIIGLLIAGTQIMMGMKFSEGATLLVALTGCLITAFGAIGFVLHNPSKRWIVNTIVVILGIALTVFALIYGGKYAM